MAFDTIPASGSTPVQFVGTDGPDSINIRTTETFILTGQAGVDVVDYGTPISNSLISLGDDADIFTGNISGGGTLSATRVNGNAGNDTLGNPLFGMSVTISNPSVVNAGGSGSGMLGGQGDDTMYVTFMQSSRVNGNLGDDTLFIGVPGGTPTDVSDSDIFGGQGDDLINATEGGTTSYFNTTIGGNLGNDIVNVSTAGTVQSVSVEGNDGNDRLTINGWEDLNNNGIITANELGTFNDVTATGGIGNDTITISFVRNGSVTADGGEGEDLIDASTGTTSSLVLNGGGAADSILGGAGNDTIDGGLGADVIVGNGGADELTGGSGNNRFVQRANSTGAVVFNNENDPGFFAAYDEGDTFTIAGGADVITDWNTGSVNVLDTDVTGLTAAANANLANGFLFFLIGNTDNLAFRGRYDAATGVFTISNTGGDIGVVTKAGPSELFDYADNFTVLSGVGGTVLTASDFEVVNPII